MLVFHIVLGKTVPDISRNAIANLGYADLRFLKPVYPGDTLASTTEIIGLKENSNRKNGTVYVRSTGRNQHGRAGADLLPLGDGEQARRGRAGARAACPGAYRPSRCGTARRGAAAA